MFARLQKMCHAHGCEIERWYERGLKNVETCAEVKKYQTKHKIAQQSENIVEQEKNGFFSIKKKDWDVGPVAKQPFVGKGHLSAGTVGIPHLGRFKSSSRLTTWTNRERFAKYEGFTKKVNFLVVHVMATMTLLWEKWTMMLWTCKCWNKNCASIGSLLQRLAACYFLLLVLSCHLSLVCFELASCAFWSLILGLLVLFHSIRIRLPFLPQHYVTILHWHLCWSCNCNIAMWSFACCKSPTHLHTCLIQLAVWKTTGTCWHLPFFVWLLGTSLLASIVKCSSMGKI